MDVYIKDEIVEFGGCGEGEIEDFLDELFGVVVAFEEYPGVGGFVCQVQSVGDVHAAFVHVGLFGLVVEGLEDCSGGWCPWADHVVIGKFSEEVNLGSHLCRLGVFGLVSNLQVDYSSGGLLVECWN